MSKGALHRFDLLATPPGRRLLFGTLYISEGAPIGFVWWALPTLLSTQDVGLAATTTLTSLATLPWIFKFLLAPAIDAGLARGIGTKPWIVACQFGMAVSLIPLALLDWADDLHWVTLAVVVHASFAAMQDVAIDTLAIRSVPPEELGRINGWMQAGMLSGRAAAAAVGTAGVAVVGGPGAAVLFVVVLICLPLLLVIAGVQERVGPPGMRRPFSLSKELLDRPMMLGLMIALTVAAGFEFFGVSAGARLLEIGAAETTVALFFAGLAPFALAVGALIGGAIADRHGALRATVVALLALTALVGGVGLADVGGVAWFSLVYFGIGLLTASSYALFMTLSRGRLAATRFSLLMAMTNACEAWAGFAGGRLAEGFGYGSAVVLLAGAACISLIPLFMLARQPLESRIS